MANLLGSTIPLHFNTGGSHLSPLKSTPVHSPEKALEAEMEMQLDTTLIIAQTWTYVFSLKCKKKKKKICVL